ncbi:35603_t:CDS:2, partial [Racocetra persica]
KLLGDANLHYVNKEYPEAIAILQEIVKIDPNIHIAWFTLGTIQDEVGCPDKALQLYLVAAHLTPKDASLWKRLGLSSKNQNALHQAIYCFSKAIRCDPNDDDAIWDRCILYGEIGEYRKVDFEITLLLFSFLYSMKTSLYSLQKVPIKNATDFNGAKVTLTSFTLEILSSSSVGSMKITFDNTGCS